MEVDGESWTLTNNKHNTTITAKIYNCISLLAETLQLVFCICYYVLEDIVILIFPAKKQNVENEIVLITGAGHGIGKELALGYASLGATVVCWDINQETNKQTMIEIKQMGKESVYAYKCDISNRDEVFSVAEKVRKEVGDVTILLNNAGTGIAKTLLDFNKDEIDKVIDLNFKAQCWMLQAFLPRMIENNHGHIVAVSSLLAFLFGKNGTIYCATKAAVKIFMEGLYDELRSYNNGKSAIKLTTVYPALVLTGLIKKAKLRFVIKSMIISSKKAASLIIDAQRRNLRKCSIPSHLLFFIKLINILPAKAVCSIMDFIDIKFET